MAAKIAELTLWTIALFAVGGVGIFLLKRLFGMNGGSVVEDFKTHSDRAQSLEAEVKKLKEESTRGTADFNEALKKYRAKFGSGKRPDGTPR